jgi:hypothetical protein
VTGKEAVFAVVVPFLFSKTVFVFRFQKCLLLKKRSKMAAYIRNILFL